MARGAGVGTGTRTGRANSGRAGRMWIGIPPVTNTQSDILSGTMDIFCSSEFGIFTERGEWQKVNVRLFFIRRICTWVIGLSSLWFLRAMRSRWKTKKKKGTLSRSLRAGVRKPTITWAGDDLTARSSERKRRGKPSACRDWTELLCKGGTEKKGGGACVCG